MKKHLAILVLLACFLEVSAKEVVDAEIDYSKYKDISEVPFFGWRGSESAFARLSIKNGCLHFENSVAIDPNWECQFLPIGDVNAEVGVVYTLHYKIKGDHAGNVSMIGFGQTPWGQFPITTDWVEGTVDYEANNTDGNMTMQCGDWIGSWDLAFLKITHKEKEEMPVLSLEWITNDGKPTIPGEATSNKYMGDAETPWANPNVKVDDQTQNYLICAWTKEKGVNIDAGGNWNPFPATIIREKDGNHCYVVHGKPATSAGDASGWDNQFWIQSPKAWNAGDRVRIKFRYKASKNVTTQTQVHKQNPGDYLIWHAIGDINFTTDWQVFDQDMKIEDDMSGCWSIAFNLNTYDKNAIDFYFDDLSWQTQFDSANDAITIDKVNYTIKSFEEGTMIVTNNNAEGHLTIPSTIKLFGSEFKVTGTDNNAFTGCENLISISLPNTLQKESVGKSLFSVCKNLAAINWEPSFPMTEVMLGGITNPNLLFYTKNAAYAPSSVKNVVVNGTAEEITLSDAEGSNNFYCPTEFTAKKISYTHNYKMTSGFGGKAQGWETIALPFDVKEIRHISKGTALPFAAWNNSTSAKPFWLYSLSAGGFSRASSIQANTPYIICMPNNEEYDADYILSGAVTFSATNAKVKASSSVSNGKSGTKTFVPAFCAQEKSSKVYALNVNNDIHSERGGYDEGSRFVSNLRTVSPFEAYMTDSSAGAKLTIDIEFSDATGIDELTGDRDNGTSVYTIMGQKLKDSRLKNGTLPQGIYIKNGRKVSIRK